MKGLYLSNQQLRLCEQLKYLGFKQSFEVGSHIGRGFADLGFEQFVVLPQDKILSLFTGHKSDLEQDYQRHFFLVPGVDELLMFLAEHGCVIKQLGSDADGSWAISMTIQGQVISNQAQTLWQVLLECCLQVGEQGKNVAIN